LFLVLLAKVKYRGVGAEWGIGVYELFGGSALPVITYFY